MACTFYSPFYIDPSLPFCRLPSETKWTVFSKLTLFENILLFLIINITNI